MRHSVNLVTPEDEDNFRLVHKHLLRLNPTMSISDMYRTILRDRATRYREGNTRDATMQRVERMVADLYRKANPVVLPAEDADYSD